jgi:hypothetical protein
MKTRSFAVGKILKVRHDQGSRLKLRIRPLTLGVSVTTLIELQTDA